MDTEKPDSYSKAGVDIKRETQAIDAITTWIQKSFKFRDGLEGEVMQKIGSFANLIEFGDKALALCMDGVGSKVLVAQELDKYDTVGIDLVAMNVNDAICLGAEPIAMVDYLAMEKVDYQIAKELAAGIFNGAEQAQIAVIGGETATLPEMVKGLDNKGFDLAATVLGMVEKDKIITGDKIQPGDKIIGFKSSGIHSNGLTLARKVLPKSMYVNLLTPTRIYVKEVMNLIKNYEIHGLANITGGGVLNLNRLCKYGYILDNMPEPQQVFKQIQELGNIGVEEMYKTFNMGVGFVAICDPATTEKIMSEYSSEYQLSIIGEVKEAEGVTLIVDDTEYVIT